jgi:glycerol-3-phosphate cytidylyltransferase
MRYGILASAFDPIHPGHIFAIEQAIYAGVCDKILAALHIDPTVERPDKHKPFMTVEERQIMLSGMRYIGWCEIYKTEPELHGLMIRYRGEISVRIIGEDHKEDKNTGDDIDIPVFFAKRRNGWSSTEFIKRIQSCHLPS